MFFLQQTAEQNSANVILFVFAILKLLSLSSHGVEINATIAHNLGQHKLLFYQDVNKLDLVDIFPDHTLLTDWPIP